jgi:hypothetical protein
MDGAALRWAESTLRSRYERVVTHSRLFVDFRCDPVSERPSEIVFESGYGHGQNLVLWRLTRNDSEERYRAQGISFRWTRGGYSEYSYPIAEDFELRLAHGEIPSSVIDPHLERSRTAVAAILHEIELIPPPGAGLGMRGRFSTSDTHLLIRFASSGAALERRYTGYEGPRAQSDLLPLRLAHDPLLKATSTLPWESTAPTDEDRAFFVDRFLASFGPEQGWWVRERFLALASRLGTPELIPALLTAAAKPEGREPVQAINALAAITGWDIRYDGKGKPRPPVEVAREYASECER